MKMWHVILVAAAVSAIVTFGVGLFPWTSKVDIQSPQSSNYSRIVSTKTIRCGYVIAPPMTIKDPNTGKLSGLSFDIMEAAAKQAGYRLVWAEQVDWATMIEGLQTGRYDMICSGVWVNTARAQFADFTAPVFFNAVNVYVRSGDNRFDNGLSIATKYAAINRPDVTIATIDGEITANIADQSFPQSRRFSLSQNADLSQLLLTVVDRKADVTFIDPYSAAQFLRSHPGTLRDISSDRPIRIYPYSFLIPKGDYALKSLIDAALSEVINSGQVDQLIPRYDVEPGTIYPLAYPYRGPINPTDR